MLNYVKEKELHAYWVNTSDNALIYDNLENSTIDVFKTPVNVNETTKIDTKNLHAYGYNRYQLECWVRENYPDALIIRLPALFGINLKKNFIYDFINLIPYMLTEKKMEELSLKEYNLKKYYKLEDNNFYKFFPIFIEKLFLYRKQKEGNLYLLLGK